MRGAWKWVERQLPFFVTVCRLFEQFVPLPVFMKENRSRMRGKRTPLVILAATALTCFAGLLILFTHLATSLDLQAQQEIWAATGRDLLMAMLLMQAGAVAVLVPGLSAGIFALERETESLDLLLLTPLTNANLVAGKILSAVGFLTLLIFCALPLAGVALIMGGVTPLQLLLGEAVLVATIFALGAISAYCSTWFLRTPPALMLAYTIGLTWVGLTPAVFLIMDRFSRVGDFLSLLMSAVLTIPFALLSAWFAARRLATAMQREPSRAFFITVTVVFLLFWFCITSLVPYAYLNATLANSNPEYLLMGNPFATIYILQGGGVLGIGDEFANNYPYLTILIQSLMGGIFFALTCNRLARMRAGGAG